MFKTFLYPIRSRLILALLIPLLPLVAGMILITWNSNQQQLERANESTENFALIASGYQKELISGLKQLLNVIVEGTDFKSGDDNCTRSLNKIVARLGNYSTIAIVNKDGIVTCASGEAKNTFIYDRDYFSKVRDTLQFTISDRLIGKAAGRPVLVGAMPWTDENGELGGMVIASIESERFAASFRTMPLPPGSTYYLLDRRGDPVAESGSLSPKLHAALEKLPPGIRSATPFVLKEDGVSRTYSTVGIENGALTVVIGIPRRFFLGISTGNFLISLLGPIAVLIVMIVLIWYLSNKFVTAPVTALIRTARAYSNGDLSVRPLTNASGGEIRQLSTTFSEMADRIAEREHQLQEAIHKRELMMREIHHRVKNNLQIVISLVNLQSKSVALPAAQEAFTEIQTRMRALALVHRYLYESDDLQSVNIGSFLTELCTSLQLAYGVPPTRVAMEVKTDPVWDISDRAIPLALFMTETISNALRHAFPEGRPGYIKVTLKALENGRAFFSVEDNGVGIESMDQTETSTKFQAQKPLAGLGMSLTKAFARQIDGELTIGGPPGTVISLLFKTRWVPPAG